MARLIDQLTALKVAKVKAPGWYRDGGGLILQVTGDGDTQINKSWLFQFRVDGRQRQMGLGSLTLVSLAEAREKAKEAKRLLLAGVDPIAARQVARVDQKLAQAKAITFEQCAERYIASHRAAWKSQKHADQWVTTLKTYAYPSIGSLPVQAIETVHVVDLLEPIWSTKTETAARLRGRIEVILGWAKVRGQRIGDNPARWKDHLDKLLPKPSKLRKVQHHPALPYAEMGTFMWKLRRQEGIAARALEYTILTTARTMETLKAEWPEIEATDAAWIVPAGRMKGEREHRVPLSSAAGAVLKRQRAKRKNDERLIFPSGKEKGKPLSENAMLALLERMDYGHITVHGFRSTFRDWAADRTDYADAVVEVALSHVNDDETEAAYKRTDLFDKRRALMNDWATFCATPSDEAVAEIASQAEADISEQAYYRWQKEYGGLELDQVRNRRLKS
jgi:integrase